MNGRKSRNSKEKTQPQPPQRSTPNTNPTPPHPPHPLFPPRSPTYPNPTQPKYPKPEPRKKVTPTYLTTNHPPPDRVRIKPLLVPRRHEMHIRLHHNGRACRGLLSFLLHHHPFSPLHHALPFPLPHHLALPFIIPCSHVPPRPLQEIPMREP